MDLTTLKIVEVPDLDLGKNPCQCMSMFLVGWYFHGEEVVYIFHYLSLIYCIMGKPIYRHIIRVKEDKHAIDSKREVIRSTVDFTHGCNFVLANLRKF